jgi:xanthine dehydrogenase YagS FAD-binding subunit
LKSFNHLNAKTVTDAVTLLTQYGTKAKIIAGGTDLLGSMKDDILPTYPDAVVNLKTISGLDYIKEEGGMLKMGALAKLYDIYTSAAAKNYTALVQAAHSVASPHIREMGTIAGNVCQDVRCWYYRWPDNHYNCLRKGGSMCYASGGDNRFHSIFGGKAGCYAVFPSDTAPALMAMNASIVTNKRTVPVDSFFDDLKGTVLDPNEVVTEVQVPTPAAGTKSTYIKFRVRKAIDFPIVGVAAMITVSGGTVSAARIALGAVAPKPLRAAGAEDALKGKAISADVAATAAAAAVKDAVNMTKNRYKIQITQALVKQAILA